LDCSLLAPQCGQRGAELLVSDRSLSTHTPGSGPPCRPATSRARTTRATGLSEEKVTHHGCSTVTAIGGSAFLLRGESLSRRRSKSQADAKMAVFEWIEGWYNPHRRHSAHGYRSPLNYERAPTRQLHHTEDRDNRGPEGLQSVPIPMRPVAS
jgi:transposase InsO family protein